MNTVLQASPENSNFRMAYITGGANLFGGSLGSSGVVTGTNAGASSLFLSSVTPMNGNYSVSLSFDQKVGTDANINATTLRTGSSSNSTLNLDTTAQDRVSGRTAVAAHVEMLVANNATQTITISGTDVTATLTTSNGLSLSLGMGNITRSGSATLILDPTAVANHGYQGVSIELSTGLSAAGGFATFDLDNGVKF